MAEGHRGWALEVQPLHYPWTFLPSISALPSSPRGHQEPPPGSPAAPLAEHRLLPDTFTPPLALSPNSYPALEFFMGFYLVLTRLHGLSGPRFIRYLSPSQALTADGPPAPQTPPTQSSMLLPREWASQLPCPLLLGPGSPPVPSQLLEHYSQGCWGWTCPIPRSTSLQGHLVPEPRLQLLPTTF